MVYQNCQVGSVIARNFKIMFCFVFYAEIQRQEGFPQAAGSGRGQSFGEEIRCVEQKASPEDEDSSAGGNRDRAASYKNRNAVRARMKD